MAPPNNFRHSFMLTIPCGKSQREHVGVDMEGPTYTKPSEVVSVLQEIQQTAAQTAASYAASGDISSHIPWRMVAAILSNAVKELGEALQFLPDPQIKFQ